MIVYHLEPKPKFRLMCEGGYIIFIMEIIILLVGSAVFGLFGCAASTMILGVIFSDDGIKLHNEKWMDWFSVVIGILVFLYCVQEGLDKITRLS